MLLVLGPHVGIRALGSIWLSLTPGVEEELRREGAVFDRAKARKRRTIPIFLSIVLNLLALELLYLTKLNIHIS